MENTPCALDKNVFCSRLLYIWLLDLTGLFFKSSFSLIILNGCSIRRHQDDGLEGHGNHLSPQTSKIHLHSNKYILINNYFKSQWTKCSDQKTWSGIMDNKPKVCCLRETHFRVKDTHRLKVRNGKRYFMKMEVTIK